MKQQSRKAQMRSRAERRKDLADACLKMRIDVTLTFPSTDEKIAAECKSTSWCKSHAPRRMRSGGRYSGRFATTVDYVAKKARIDRGDKADLIDNEGFEGGTPHDPARTRHARDDRRLRRWRLLRPQHVNTPPSSATRGGTGIQPGQGNRQRSGGRNCVRNRRTKTAIRSSGLARLLQTCRRAPPIRKSNRRGPHSPATRSTDRGGEQTQGERRAGSTVQLLCRQSE